MGQLMGIVGPILLLGGAIYVFSKRCELLGICGDSTPDSGTVAATPTTEVAGNVDESASNQDANGNWAGGSKSCCHCEMQGDRVKCQRHGGPWFNPPAGSGGSNDQSVELSLEECNKECGTTGTDPQTQQKNQVKSVVCPAGQASVNGKCQTISGKGSNTSGGSKSSPKTSTSTPKSSVTGSGQPIKPKPGTSTAQYFNANPKGYKPGGGTYYTQQRYRSYFVDPNYVRPFNLYHRIGNVR